MMSFPDQPLQIFLDALAAGTPAPGGGSATALSGALGASLVAMACRLTIGRKNYAAVEDEMQTILARAEILQRELRDLMQTDIDAYSSVMNAYQLSKNSDAEKITRNIAIQTALQLASQVPLIIAEKCAEVLDLAHAVAAKANRNAASDVGVGALMAQAGLHGASFNALTNLKHIHDDNFTRERRARANYLIAFAAQRQREILQLVEGRP